MVPQSNTMSVVDKKICTLCGEIKVVCAFPKRKSYSTGLYSWCKTCCKIKGHEYYLKCREQIKNRMAKYSRENRELLRKKEKQYRKAHPEIIRKYKKTYYLKKRQDNEFIETEKTRKRKLYAENQEKERERNQKWKRNNREKNLKILANWKSQNQSKATALQAKRRTQKLKAKPSWADDKAINMIYEKARELTKKTGIVHHVDHIIPLNSDTVCGLHVDYNLQIISALENLKKGNRLLV